jgi:hypothetical protein
VQRVKQVKLVQQVPLAFQVLLDLREIRAQQVKLEIRVPPETLVQLAEPVKRDKQVQLAKPEILAPQETPAQQAQQVQLV